MEMNLTQHARSRLQQRGIPLNILEPLLIVGHEEHDHHGGPLFVSITAPKNDCVGPSEKTPINGWSRIWMPMLLLRGMASSLP
jgi:hypothetical protein